MTKTHISHFLNDPSISGTGGSSCAVVVVVNGTTLFIDCLLSQIMKPVKSVWLGIFSLFLEGFLTQSCMAPLHEKQHTSVFMIVISRRVSLPGTPASDTACVRCPPGHFSVGGSSTEPCLPHRNCTDLGLKTLRQGTSTSDSLCGGPHKSPRLECSQHHTLCHTGESICISLQG